MRRIRAVAVAGVLMLLMSLLAAAPAYATQQWTPPEVLGVQVDDVDMDVNASGDAVAVWTSERSVKASYRPAGRDWQRPVVVRRVPAEAEVSKAQLVGAFIDDAGRATAVWAEGTFFAVADRTAGGGWHFDERTPSGGYRSWTSTPTARADAAGNLVLTWDEVDDFSGDDFPFYWRSRAGLWTDGGPRGGSFYNTLTVNDGVATIAKGGNGVYVQTGRMGERLGEAQAVWPGVNVGEPVMAENRRGDLVLAALDGADDADGVMRVGEPGQLIVLTKPVGQPWRGAFAEDVPEQAVSASVAINDAGKVAVAYARASDSVLEVREGDVSGGATSEPVQLSVARTATASIALNRYGNAVVTWVGEGSSDRPPVYAAHHPAAGPWSEPVRIGAAGPWSEPVRTGPQIAAKPAVYAYPNGMFTALFNDGAVQWTDYVDDTVGPRATMRAPRTAYTTSTRMTVRWDVTDPLSRPRSSDVRVRARKRTGAFGDWRRWRTDTETTSQGFTGKPGRTYCFSVRGRDRVGNLGAWSRHRCTSTPVDDRAFTATGDWSRVKQRSAYLRTLSISSKTGERLRLEHVRATSLRLLARTCPTCGNVRVTHGGRNLGVFDLSSPQSRKRVILLAEYGRPQGGAVVIRVARGGGPVQIDGLATTR